MALPLATVATAPPRLGLRANGRQFALLVLVNAFVGGMVGLERTVVPLIGAEEFGIASTVIVTSFIVSFGLVKACANLVSGLLADEWGRKRVLIVGWLLGMPVPLLIIFAPNWGWIVAANVLLGLNQGFAWSMTVVMKVDLVGPARRGLALGLNEFAGYFAVGATAFATGYIAAHHGLRPAPFYLGIGYAVFGLTLSLFLVRDTRAHARFEAANHATADATTAADSRFRTVFALTTWKNRSLFAISQAGLINNLNDGMSWGIFPLFFFAHGVSIAGIGLIKAIYPVTWSVGQLVTGPLSDRWGRKGLIMWGMWLQALALLVIALGAGAPFATGMSGSVLLGAGTAMVYPALLAGVGDVAHPAWRARSLSVYRFWRDMGYAIGALLAGIIADALGFRWSIQVVAALTALSGIIVWRVMRETHPSG
ncbi:MAG: MFS transporter [Thermomicrobiales bacterium]